MAGYMGEGLHVDLTSGSIERIPTPRALTDLFIGGRGLGIALIGKQALLDTDDPALPLIFSTGPLVGTPAPTSGRSTVMSRSPLTGTVFDCSVGGRFGTELKKAGIDFIRIVGRSERWVYLIIENDTVSLREAGTLVGEHVSATRQQLGAGGADAVIGLAGERGVRLASIVFDGHYLAGRGGLGAIMGGKRLKAIKVSGAASVPVHNRAGLTAARDEIMRLLRASQAVFGELGLAEFGTAALVDLIHARRMEPTRNFRETFFPVASAYSGYHLKERYQAKKTGCAGCPILCKKKGSSGEIMPEYETVSHFGALLMNSDVDTIIEANRLCNEFGLDTISTAATLACYAELEGICLSPADLLALIGRIGMNEPGIGALLAEGSLSYARSRGRAEASISVKGLELPAYDPRGAYGMALSYATSNRGGCHLRAYPISHEILRKPVATDRFTFEGKARIIKIAEDLNAVVDSMTACKFVFFAATLEEYAQALQAVTGIPHDTQSLLRTGERIVLLERYLNSLNGFSVRDDDLPERFFTEEGSSSDTIRIAPLDRGAFIAARSAYYRVRHCDDQGHPSADYLTEIGLAEFL